jgi:hypothetical protein
MNLEPLCQPKNKAVNRYNKRFFATMPFYVGFLLGAIYILKHYHPGRVATVLLSILPSLPIIAIIVIVGLYIKEETDEFQRAVYLQALLWTTGITLAVASVWGFLEMFANLPHVPTFYTFPAYWFLFGICYPLVRLQYRSTPDE